MKNVGVKCAVVLERGWRWTHVDFYLQTSGEMELDLSEASHHETSAALKEKKNKKTNFTQSLLTATSVESLVEFTNQHQLA